MQRKKDIEELQRIYVQAVALHEQGELDEAARCYSRVVAELPDADVVHYNLGLVHFEQDRHGEAAGAFRRAAELQPHDPDNWYNLGLALKRCGRFAEAEQAYLHALELSPDDPDILYNLGCCHKDGGEAEKAVAVYEELLERDPGYTPALNNLAYLHHLLGHHDRARDLYRRLLAARPGHPAASHMLAALEGRAVAEPPGDYVRDLFDQFSEYFEEKLLEKLGYRVPFLLHELLVELTGDPVRYGRAIDLGCGTGLVGETFRSTCDHLTGIDLSPRMIEVAAGKQVYDRLAVSDLVPYLERSKTPYDLLVAADVLIYLGDLAPLFEAAFRAAGKGAFFVFSTERGESGWALRPTGRYAHGRDYIAGMAAATGWQVAAERESGLRREGGDWLEGDLWVLRRS
ncbi:MAG TPA: tetratricopeptide repeat protein [Desulfobulbus sp.]|nr:tetratricopeptide repeat protein [Desulfobulbus sp.]